MSDQIELAAKRARSARLSTTFGSAPADSTSSAIGLLASPSLTVPPWPFYRKSAASHCFLKFQYPCGSCRRLNQGQCTTLVFPDICACNALAWCSCDCGKRFCVSCFEKTDDAFLASLCISSTDWHPFTLRNIPIILSVQYPRFLASSTDGSLEPQTPFNFALYAPEEATSIAIQMNMPWPSIRINRDGIVALPPSTWPRTRSDADDINHLWHPGQNARAAREYALTVALQNVQHTQENARLHSEEARRLEFEDDCGVHLEPLRNCRPQDTALYSLRLAHQPPSALCIPLSASAFLSEALSYRDSLPSVASWPTFDPLLPFKWCCGECRSRRDSVFLQAAVVLPMHGLCNCGDRSVILCPSCKIQHCYACFIVLDEFFLFSFKSSYSARTIREFRNLQSMPTPHNSSPNESVDEGDACDSSPPSQTSASDALLESRKGSASFAASILFAAPKAIPLSLGYVVNDFVVPDSFSSASLPSESGSEYIDSCPDVCNECGQLLPPSQLPSSTNLTAATPIPEASTLVTSVETRSGIASSIVALPAAAEPPRAAPLIIDRAAEARAIIARAAPVARPSIAQPPQQRIFVFATSKMLPVLPPLARIVASTSPLTEAAHSHTPPVAIQNVPGSPLAPLPAVVGAPHSSHLAAPRASSPLQPIASPPAPPLIGIHKNPGPPPLQLNPPLIARLRAGIVQGPFLSPREFMQEEQTSRRERRTTPTRLRPSQLPPGLPGLHEDSDNSEADDSAAYHNPSSAPLHEPGPLIGVHSHPGPVTLPALPRRSVRTTNAPTIFDSSHTPSPCVPLSHRSNMHLPLSADSAADTRPTPGGIVRGVGTGHPHHAVFRPPPTRPSSTTRLSSNPLTDRTDEQENDLRTAFASALQASHSAYNDFPLAAPRQDEALPTPAATQEALLLRSSINLHHRHRQHQFPLGLVHSEPIGCSLPAYMAFRIECTFYPDGGSRDGIGSWAVLARSRTNVSILTGYLPLAATNNLAELTAILKALRFARKKKFVRILLVSDSEIAVKFLKGQSTIEASNLFDIVADIMACIPLFEAIYVSHINSHLGVSIENDVADALCTWVLSSKIEISSLALSKTASNLIPLLTTHNIPHLSTTTHFKM
jgi:ribonuclease HI